MRLYRIAIGTLAVLAAASALAQERGIGIAAVVDDQVISTIDLSDRVALVIGTTGIPDNPETRTRIVPQIVRQLVDEKLQLEEAARDGITISEARLKEGLAHIEQQNGKAPGSLESYLDEKGLSKLSMYAQVRAQLAWSEIVLKKIRPRIKISDQEVTRYAHRKEAAAAPVPKPVKMAEQGRVKEVLIEAIHLPVDAPQNEANIHKLAEKLAHDIRSGASFEAVATQFSSSTGSAKVTPLWVEVSDIDRKIAEALSRAGKGGVTDPVRTVTGFQIVKLVDVRRGAPPASTPAHATSAAPAVAEVEEARAELAFKQILMSLKSDAKPKEAALLLDLAKEVQQSPGKCEERSMAGAGDLSDLDFRISFTRALSTELPEKLRNLMMKMHAGQVSSPVVTPQGIRLFMLCERIDLPPTKKAAESEDSVRQAIYTEKLELEAQKYMRDLRRQAFIEVRIH